jgi:hypothetical protein
MPMSEGDIVVALNIQLQVNSATADWIRKSSMLTSVMLYGTLTLLKTETHHST